MLASMSTGNRGRPRTVTMADVARETGVSRQLVSLVIRGEGYVAPSKRALVLEAAERLGYRRNQLAASLAGQRTFSIGLAAIDIHNQVYADFTQGVSEVLEPAGYQLLVAVAPFSPSTPRHKNIESLVGLRVDGLLVADHASDSRQFAELVAGTPCVTLGEVSTLNNVDAVSGNDYLGTQLATEHLIAQGHRHIAYLSGPANQQNQARRDGYRDAMFAASLMPFELDGDATEAAGSVALQRLHDTGTMPSAIVCYNDASAIGVLSRAEGLGIAIPQQLAVIGYDNTRPAGYPGVGLTSIDQRAQRIGAEAAALLLERIESPDRPQARRVLDPELVIRRTSQHMVPTAA